MSIVALYLFLCLTSCFILNAMLSPHIPSCPPRGTTVCEHVENMSWDPVGCGMSWPCPCATRVHAAP